MLRFVYNAREEMTNKMPIILKVSHSTMILSAEIHDLRLHPNTSARLANRC